MILTPLDWLVIAAYFALNLAIGFFYMRRASGGIGEFFLSGRNVSWWLAGTSMVATTFGADTPLVVTGLIYAQGIAGNWLWWSFLLSGMLTVFFFAPLWRRARVLTDMEFAELRYSGPPATFLRGFRAVYLAVPVNTIIMGWVNLAMAKILALTLGLTTTRQQLTGVFCCLALTLAYNAVSGLWAVLWTDLVQFILKMSMVILLAYFAVRAVGGMGPLAAHVRAFDAAHAVNGHARDTLAFIPSSASPFFLSFLVLLAPQLVGELVSGGRAGRRRIHRPADLFREEREALPRRDAVVQHRALRAASVAVDSDRSRRARPAAQPHRRAGRDGGRVRLGDGALPAAQPARADAGGVRGGVYVHHRDAPEPGRVVHDQRHLQTVLRGGAQREALCCRVARSDDPGGGARAPARLGFMLTHGASIATAWKFLLSLGAGAGLVFILRWYWWRINAWSEIAAMTAAATISLTLESAWGMPAVRALHRIDPALALAPLNQDDPHAFAWLMLTTTLLTTAIWLAVTLATQPETEATLQTFYDRVRPAALGWRRFAQAREQVDSTLGYNFFHWVLGFTLVYAMLFGVGDLLFGRIAPGCGLLALSGACLAVLFYSLNRRGWSVWR